MQPKKRKPTSERRDTLRLYVHETVTTLRTDTLRIPVVSPPSTVDRILSSFATAGAVFAAVAAWRSARLSKEQIKLSHDEQLAARHVREAEGAALKIEFESLLAATIRELESLSAEAIDLARNGGDNVGWVRGYHPRVYASERDVRSLLAQAAQTRLPLSQPLRAAQAHLATLVQQLAQLVSRSRDHGDAQAFPVGWRNQVLGVDLYHGQVELALSSLRAAAAALNSAVPT